MNKYNIPKLIKARILKGWTQGDLALRIGLSQNMIWKVEKGTRCSEKTIFKMARALNVKMSEILIDDAVSSAGRTLETAKRR